jgi:hypothetical protein
MMKEEESAQEFFQEMRETFQIFLPTVWEKEFKTCVDEFIDRHLKEARYLMGLPCSGESEEEDNRICLHGIRRLVAGAVQEWELVQQPESAAACAKIDRALVWHGRGYEVPTRLSSLHLNHFPRVHLNRFLQRYGW